MTEAAVGGEGGVPLIPGISEFEARLIYIVSSRLTRLESHSEILSLKEQTKSTIEIKS